MIKGYMFNELKLGASEAVVFSFINSFEKGFDGSLQYIADSTGLKKRQAQNIIDSLIKKGYVIKTTRVGKTSNYTIAKIAIHHSKNCYGTVAKIATNNNEHINNYKLNNKKSGFNDFDQRVYNFSELEKLIRSN